MESFEAFINIFRRAVSERNGNDLRYVLEDGHKYFRDISSDDTETILAELFHNDYGLLSFLNAELAKIKSHKTFDMAVKEAFGFLKFIMEHFNYILTKFEIYMTNIKSTCTLAVTTSCSFTIQKAAATTYIRFIELFHGNYTFIEEVEILPSYFMKLNIKERSLVLSVLCVISKYSPEPIRVKGCFNLIFYQMRNDFKKQYKPHQDQQAPEIETYLNAFSNLLAQLADEVQDQYWSEMYDWIKHLSVSCQDQRKKVIMRTAINLLSEHIEKFAQFVYDDHTSWYNCFTRLAHDYNKEQSECGQRALKKLYYVIGATLKERNSAVDKSIFTHFKNYFEKELEEDAHLQPSKFTFIVYGYSQMAAPCKIYLTGNDVRRMFLLIGQCAKPLCFIEPMPQENLKSISHYLEALSDILIHMETLSIDEVQMLTKLGVLMIKNFPELPVTSQSHAIMALKKMIASIDNVHKYRSEELLYNLIQEGIIWSCSHTLFIDAELQRELRNLKERPVCYKNYLLLWSQFLKLDSDSTLADKHVAQELTNTIMHVCIDIISKLNLNTKVKEDETYTDTVTSETAVNNSDFRIFINIVDLYVDILNNLEHGLLANNIHDFLLTLIKLSYKHPHVSGFYKLVRQCCRHIDMMNKTDHELEIMELLYDYLSNVSTLIPTLCNELLITCLYLMLDTPIVFVERLLDHAVPGFKICFHIGLSDFELAYTALDTLEKWNNHLEKPKMRSFLQEIITALASHLQNEESIAEFSQEIIKTERKRTKRIIFLDKAKNLENFQRRILLFIASLDTDIVTDFVYKRSLETGATWDKKDLMRCPLPLSDVKVDMYFDSVLPRLITLAENSNDRRTKIMACEELYLMVVFLFGKTSETLTSSSERYLTAYKKLCPVLLNLGSDCDEVARQIFQPLILQLTHWLSSNIMLQSPITSVLLESLFNGLCSESNSALREFCGSALAEFTKWSIKQSGDDAKSLLNIDEVINKMMYFALHPSATKRVAAAVAFNHLYMILREEEEVVTIYWLHIFYCFIRSLKGCNDRSIHNALDHVLRVLIAKEHLFNEAYNKRKKPHEFENATLMGMAKWLFSQCGSLDEHCRAKSMQLFLYVSECVEDHNSAESVIQSYITDNGIEAFNEVVLAGTEAKIEHMTLQNTESLLRTLDCYIWLINEQIIDVELLFSSQNPKKDVIFDCIQNFIHLLFTDDCKCIKVLYQVIMTTFNFLQTLFRLEDCFIPEFLLNEELFKLISLFIMEPVTNFDASNFNTFCSHSTTVENVLNLLMEKKSHDSFMQDSLKQILASYVDKHINDFCNPNELVCGRVTTELKLYVQGLITLERCQVLGKLYKDKRVLSNREDKIECLFKILTQEKIGNVIYIDITHRTLDYLRDVMELYLVHYEPVITKKLIQLIANNIIPSNEIVPQGLHFLNIFKSSIFRYMLKDIKGTFEIFQLSLQETPLILLTIVEGMMIFLQRNKKDLYDTAEEFVDTITKHFAIFERAVNNMEERKEKLISIFKMAVSLKKNPTALSSISLDYHSWILHQLTDNFDIVHKTRILQSFLPSLVDAATANNPALVAILYRLVVKEKSDQNVLTIKEINCFQTLVTLLPVTKSIIVLEAVVLSATSASEKLYNEKTAEYLGKYFNAIEDVQALQSLQRIYTLFMDINKEANERFDILNKFCIPSFQFCTVSVIEKFFERNIKETCTVINRKLVGNAQDIKQNIISKIGCYNIVGIMFAKVPMENIESVHSCITCAAVDNPQTGKELVLQLFGSAVKVREQILIPEHSELIRLLHCSAYNCCIAIVSLKNNEDPYLKLFAETPQRRIWENIVDCNKYYNIQQTFKEYPRNRERLINIRRDIRATQTRTRFHHIHTYDLSYSSLSQDVTTHDLNDFVVHSDTENNETEESMRLTLECDELNEHECMASICGVLEHMMLKNIITLTTDNNVLVPKWYKCFFQSMMQTNNKNVKLFMLKIISNVPAVFKCYAQFSLPRIMHVIYQYLNVNHLNYVITDVLMLLLEWHNVAIPKQVEEGKAAQKLWELLIQKTTLSNTKDTFKAIYNFNISLIKSFLEVWRACLKLPSNLGLVLECSQKSAIYLVLICFENGMEQEIADRNDILEFLEKATEKWQDSEEIYLQTCECIGVFLEFFKKDEKYMDKATVLKDKVKDMLLKIQTKSESRLIKCIYAMSRHWSEAALIHSEFMTANIVKVGNSDKAKCLEIFLQRINCLTPDVIRNELKYMELQTFLKNKVEPCDKVALQIICHLTTALTAKDIHPFISLILPYTKSNVTENRKMACDIFINIYKRFSEATSSEAIVDELIQLSKEVLISSVLDPDEELQQKVLLFWTDNAKLSNTSIDRLLEMLNMYTNRIGSSFLPFVLTMMFDLTSKSLDYTQPIFKPLHDCPFINYKISPLWRTKNSMAPAFAPSLANEMNQVSTQMSSILSSENYSITKDDRLRLHATQAPEFEPTAPQNHPSTYAETSIYEFIFKAPEEKQLRSNKRSPRFLNDASKISEEIRQAQIKTNVRHAEMRKEEMKRQRGSVRVYRQYRIGDFPDVEISLKSLVESLQKITKRDQQICKVLIVSICRGMMQQMKNEKCLDKVFDTLKHILSQNPHNNSITSALLEILLSCRMLDFSTNTVMKISRLNNLNFHGSLLLEEALIYTLDDTSPPCKKMRSENMNNFSDSWLHLSTLYQSINDVDIVLSIFQNHIQDQDMQEAAFAHATKDWSKSKDAFTRVYKRGLGTMQERSLQGLFECANNLCSWSVIDQHIQSTLNEDLDQIWSHPWKDWLFSWLFDTEVQKLLTLYSIRDDSNLPIIDDKDFAVMNTWLTDKRKQEFIKCFFGEQTALLFTFLKKEEHAVDFLLSTIDELRRQWIGLHPLSMELRLHKLQELRHVNDVNCSIRLLKKLALEYSPLDLQQLLKFWNCSIPGEQDFILIWDKMISYRLYFISILEERHNLRRPEMHDELEDVLSNEENNSENDIVGQLYQISSKMQLGIVKASLNQKNPHIAQKYLKLAKSKLNNSSTNLKYEFLLEAAKMKYLTGEIQSDMSGKLEHFGIAWARLQKLLKQDGLDPVTEINVRRHINKLSLDIASTCRRNSVFAQLLVAHEGILNDINAQSNDIDCVIRSLEEYSFSRLKESYDTENVDSIKECCLAMIKFCYNKLSLNETDIVLQKEFVCSTLKGMIYGCLECAHYFPCLLNVEYLKDMEIREIFSRETKRIESWMFISWQAQLFSHLGTDIAHLIIPIIERIADTYPNAIIYTLSFSIELNPVLATNTDAYKIRSILYNNPEIEKFLKAMEYIVQPELYLRYYLSEFRKDLSQGTATAIDTLLKKVYPNPRELKNNPRPGALYREIAKYEKEIKNLASKKVDAIKKWVDTSCDNLKQQLETRRDREKLKDYSPWLCEFNGNTLEIPGQYSGDKKPLPQYHTRIVKLEPFVKIMQSLRKPIRITMIGNNAKEYHFLVKFGEDLRQDQRLQQVFSIMNNALDSNTACKQRKLLIDTYKVVPLSRSLGLIEWVDDTQSLQNLIHFTLSPEQLKRYERIRSNYQTWISSVAPRERMHLQYKDALIKYKAPQVITQMKRYISETDWDALRSTFKVLCPSVESFMTLRRNFVTSYATMCIAHWILGIGDRHLQNTLIVVASGRCLGIDFGLAFDAGIDLPIPELVPFRLTPQILGLLKPFTENDLLGATMRHVLRALREGQGPILACMEVFVQEPLAWVENINKALQKSGSDQADVKWFPKKKIDIVTKKLNGIKPSVVTLEQLKELNKNDKYYDRYYHIVLGDDDIKQARTAFLDNSLSAEDQVTCLLDQATDLNILGRMYVNWKPWL